MWDIDSHSEQSFGKRRGIGVCQEHCLLVRLDELASVVFFGVRAGTVVGEIAGESDRLDGVV